MTRQSGGITAKMHPAPRCMRAGWFLQFSLTTVF